MSTRAASRRLRPPVPLRTEASTGDGVTNIARLHRRARLSHVVTRHADAALVPPTTKSLDVERQGVGSGRSEPQRARRTRPGQEPVGPIRPAHDGPRPVRSGTLVTRGRDVTETRRVTLGVTDSACDVTATVTAGSSRPVSRGRETLR
jgi:hypothetical protein